MDSDQEKAILVVKRTRMFGLVFNVNGFFMTYKASL